MYKIDFGCSLVYTYKTVGECLRHLSTSSREDVDVRNEAGLVVASPAVALFRRRVYPDGHTEFWADPWPREQPNAGCSDEYDYVASWHVSRVPTMFWAWSDQAQAQYVAAYWDRRPQFVVCPYDPEGHGFFDAPVAVFATGEEAEKFVACAYLGRGARVYEV